MVTKTITWNNSADFSGTALDYEKLTSDSGTWHDWDITNIVKKWYNGSKNYGVVLKSTNESDEEQCASFYSGSYPSSSIPRPVIAITYRNNKGLENYWSYSSFSVGTAGTAYINDYSGNLTLLHLIILLSAVALFLYSIYLTDIQVIHILQAPIRMQVKAGN